MVVRVGDAASASAATGVAQPVYIEEYDSTQAGRTPVSVIAMTSDQCTLATGKSTTGPYQWYDTEGFPQISANGQLLAFPCYSTSSGLVIPEQQSSAKTVAFVRYDGSVDVATHTLDPYGGSANKLIAFRNVATVDGTAFYAAAAPGYAGSGGQAGVFIIPYALPGGINYIRLATSAGPGYNDVRSATIFNGQLYVADSALDAGWLGISTMGVGLPNSYSQSSVILPGMAGATTMDPWTFVFENSASMYVADTYNTNQYNVVGWALVAGQWSPVSFISLEVGTPIRSIAGRTINGSFVVYAVSPTTLYAYTVSTGASVVVTTASAGVFRGVGLVPVWTNWIAASRTGTATQTPSQTATQTVSGSVWVLASVGNCSLLVCVVHGCGSGHWLLVYLCACIYACVRAVVARAHA